MVVVIKSSFSPVLLVENEPATLDPLQQFIRNWDELTPTQQMKHVSKSNDDVNTNRRAAMVRNAGRTTLTQAIQLYEEASNR